MLKLKTVFSILFLSISVLITNSFLFAQTEEQLTITTYYPSPYGNYNQLQSTGNTYLATSSGSVGIGVTDPLATFGSSAVAIAGRGQHIQTSSSYANLLLEGATGSIIRMYDTAGIANRRWFQIGINDTDWGAGEVRMLFLNDAGDTSH